MNHPKRLMILAGGTGGHVFPGIAIAHYLMEQGWHIHWIGTSDRIEADLVPKHGIKIDFIRISGLRGKSIKMLLLAPVHILGAWLQARTIIKRFNPNVVLGMGGYVSGPSGLAAWSLRIPIILHEQNSIAGLTNKWLAKIANKVTQAFPDAFHNAEVVGNPLRADILALPKPEIRLQGRKGPIRILVIGGSQGAQILNQTMPKVGKKLRDKVIIWHQSGKKSKHDVKKAYFDTGQLQHKVTGFIHDIAEAYGWADIAVCRSGALTVSEIAALGLPAVFVPFEHEDDQQYCNAVFLEKVGAAKIFRQSQFTTDVIATTLAEWDRERLLDMAKRAYSVGISNATKKLAREVNLVAKKN